MHLQWIILPCHHYLMIRHHRRFSLSPHFALVLLRIYHQHTILSNHLVGFIRVRKSPSKLTSLNKYVSSEVACFSLFKLTKAKIPFMPNLIENGLAA